MQNDVVFTGFERLESFVRDNGGNDKNLSLFSLRHVFPMTALFRCVLVTFLRNNAFDRNTVAFVIFKFEEEQEAFVPFLVDFIERDGVFESFEQLFSPQQNLVAVDGTC